jgi:hypothetical protein
MKKPPNQGMAQNPFVNAPRGTISDGSDSLPGRTSSGSCLCCLKSFSPIRIKQKFCSSRCRLLYWAAGEIIKEWRAGSASGLTDLMQEMDKKDIPGKS